MDNLGDLRGGRTGIYRRDIAHFLGAWLPDDPGETRTGHGAYGLPSVYIGRLWTSPTESERVLTEMGVISSGGFPRPGIRFKQSSCRLSPAGLVEKSCCCPGQHGGACQQTPPPSQGFRHEGKKDTERDDQGPVAQEMGNKGPHDHGPAVQTFAINVQAYFVPGLKPESSVFLPDGCISGCFSHRHSDQPLCHLPIHRSKRSPGSMVGLGKL